MRVIPNCRTRRNRRIGLHCVLVLAVTGGVTAAHAQSGEPRGAKAFQACVACHSLEPERHFTGPSLANLFGRKAGTVAGFQRYSDALQKSGVVWDDTTLDAWLRAPAGFIPGNVMTFSGLKDEKLRRDLIQYLKVADSTPAARRAGPRLPDLKKSPPNGIVKAVRHCGDTYFVTAGDGKLHKIWEFNLRLKTDTSITGPAPGKPVIVGAGMQGDRASIIFSAPGEIAKMINSAC